MSAGHGLESGFEAVYDIGHRSIVELGRYVVGLVIRGIPLFLVKKKRGSSLSNATKRNSMLPVVPWNRRASSRSPAMPEALSSAPGVPDFVS